MTEHEGGTEEDFRKLMYLKNAKLGVNLGFKSDDVCDVKEDCELICKLDPNSIKEANDQEFGFRVKWVKCCDELPKEKEIVLCHYQKEIVTKRGRRWMDFDICLGRYLNGYWENLDKTIISVHSWMKYPTIENPEHECWNGVMESVRCYEDHGKLYLEMREHSRTYQVDYCPYCGKKGKGEQDD